MVRLRPGTLLVYGRCCDAPHEENINSTQHKAKDREVEQSPLEARIDLHPPSLDLSRWSALPGVMLGLCFDNATPNRGEGRHGKYRVLKSTMMRLSGWTP